MTLMHTEVLLLPSRITLLRPNYAYYRYIWAEREREDRPRVRDQKVGPERKQRRQSMGDRFSSLTLGNRRSHLDDCFIAPHQCPTHRPRHRTDNTMFWDPFFEAISEQTASPPDQIKVRSWLPRMASQAKVSPRSEFVAQWNANGVKHERLVVSQRPLKLVSL